MIYGDFLTRFYTLLIMYPKTHLSPSVVENMPGIVTHCGPVITASENGLLPCQNQAITRTNEDI